MAYKRFWNPLHWGKSENYARARDELIYGVRAGLFGEDIYDTTAREGILAEAYREIGNIRKERVTTLGKIQRDLEKNLKTLSVPKEKTRILQLGSKQIRSLSKKTKLEDMLRKATVILLLASFISFSFTATTTGSVIGSFSLTSSFSALLGLIFLSGAFVLFQLKK